jgi:hypothetical protein
MRWQRRPTRVAAYLHTAIEALVTALMEPEQAVLSLPICRQQSVIDYSGME